jgi:integrase
MPLRPSELFALRWQSFDDANTLSLTETVYRRELRPYGKTPKSLGKMHLPDDLAAELRQWKLECPGPSPEAFMFPNADGGLIDTSNYRSRILKAFGRRAGDSKLNFQVLRRTIATRAQNLGSVKDIQSHLRHSRADTTANEYMQELPESVQQMVGTVYEMLTSGPAARQQGP